MLDHTLFTRRSLLLGGILSAPFAYTAFAAPRGISKHLVVTGFRGTAPGDGEVDDVRRLLEAGEVAGVILLRRNISSPEQLSHLLSSFREAAGSFTPILSVDQEGGAVARLGSDNGFMNWMSAAEVAALFDNDREALEYYMPRAKELADVGINLNFGPVLDLNLNPANPIIGALDRSYGKSAKTVIRLASAFVMAHRSARVMTCGKHFPGHGSARTDSHLEATDVNDTWVKDELVPFRSMAKSKLLDSVMSAHVMHRRFSDEGMLPASLSYTTMMRLEAEIGFSGPVFTDDMQMKAISSHLPEERAAVAAVLAGNTFLIYANHASSMDIGTAARINSAVSSAYQDVLIPEDVWQARMVKAAEFLAKLA